MCSQEVMFEQRAEKLLEQLEVGRNSEERVLIAKKSSKYDINCIY